MPALSDTATWRSHPYRYTPYLYVDRPETVFAARVNQASFSFPLIQLTYDTVTTGAIADAKQGMTLLLGTSAGADDLGRVRVRKAGTGTLIYVQEAAQGTHDGELNPADNAYITVINERRLWTIAPRIASGVLYKDYEIPYTEGGRNYGSRPGPLAHGGCDRIGLVDGTGFVTFSFSASNSLSITPSATLSSYSWNIKDGTLVSGALNASSMSAKFPVGRRYVELTVTDSNSDTHTHYVLVVALGLSEATWKPIFDFTIQDYRLTPDTPAMTVIVHETLSPTTYPEGAAIFYFETENYNGTDGSLAGPTTEKHIKFRGWIDAESEAPEQTDHGLERGVELRLISHAERLRKVQLLPQIVATATTPANWSEMASLTPTRFIWYVLRWHTTALDICPPIFDSLDSAYPGYQSQATTPWEQCSMIAGERAKRMTVDQRGQLRLVADPLLLDSGSRTATVIVSLTSADYDRLQLARERPPREYWIDGRGVTMGSVATPVFSMAPGTAPGQGAMRRALENQQVADQTELNARTGHEYARANSPWGPLGVRLINTGDAGIEPSLLEWVQITIPSTTNRRQRSLTSQRCLPLEVSITHSNDLPRTKEMELTLFVETVGTPGQTITISPDPGIPEFDFGWDFFPIEDWLPDLETGDLFLLAKGTRKMAAFTEQNQLWITTDFDTTEAAGGPTWSSTGLAGLGMSGTLIRFVVDPFSPGYLGTGTAVNGWIVTTSGIYRITDIFGTVACTLQHTFTYDMTGKWFAYANVDIFASWGQQNWVVCALYYNSGGVAASRGTWCVYTTDGTTWTEVHITALYQPELVFIPALFVSSRNPGTVIVGACTNGTRPTTWDGYISTNHGASFAAISNPDIDGSILSGPIDIPWEGNPTQKIAYFSELVDSATGKGPSDHKIHRLAADGSTRTEITPSDASGRQYAATNGHWSLYAAPEDRRVVLVAGDHNDNPVNSALLRVHCIFVSEDAGDSWRIVYGPLEQPLGRAVYYGAVAGDDTRVLYLWGWGPLLSYSTDRGITLDDRSGNITAGQEIVAIAGGPS